MRLYLAYQNMVGQFPAMTEFSAYNNGGSGAHVDAYKGTKDGNNHYTMDITVPAGRRNPCGLRHGARAQHRPDQGGQAGGQVGSRPASAGGAADADQHVVAQNTYKDVALSRHADGAA